jgi:DNA-binding NarL/FixJ family response regulator
LSQLPGGPIRIVIVHDQKLVADVLEALLNRQPGMLVVANVSSMPESAQRVALLSPNVMLLDYRVNDVLAVAAVKALCDSDPELKTIFLTTDSGDHVTLAAIDAGASAVLHLSLAAADVVSAIRTVADGGTLFSTETIARMLRGRRKTDGLGDLLTTREREILILVSEGASNRAIASKLEISYLTVRSHMRNMAVKLAAHSKLEVFVCARQFIVSGQLKARPTGDAAGGVHA